MEYKISSGLLVPCWFFSKKSCAAVVHENLKSLIHDKNKVMLASQPLTITKRCKAWSVSQALFGFSSFDFFSEQIWCTNQHTIFFSNILPTQSNLSHVYPDSSGCNGMLNLDSPRRNLYWIPQIKPQVPFISFPHSKHYYITLHSRLIPHVSYIVVNVNTSTVSHY